MALFFSKGKGNNKQEEKIIQLIRSWYYSNGKSIEEIITELKDGWGLGDDQIKDLLIRAGLIAPGDQYAKLPMQRKLTATEALTFNTITGTSGTASRVSTGAVKQMIDSAISDLESRLEKRIRMLDKNLSETNAIVNQYKSVVENLQKEVENLKQLMDDRSILNVLSNIRQEINEVMDKIESLRMLLNENKERISKLESKIALIQLSQISASKLAAQGSEAVSQNSKAGKASSEQGKPLVEKYSFEELFKPKVPAKMEESSNEDTKETSEPESADTGSVNSEAQEQNQFRSEIMEILKILEE